MYINIGNYCKHVKVSFSSLSQPYNINMALFRSQSCQINNRQKRGSSRYNMVKEGVQYESYR